MVEPYDTGWIDLAPLLVSPATSTSTLWVRRVDTVVAIIGYLRGSFPDTSITNLLPAGAVPADMRPGTQGSTFGLGHASGGYDAQAIVRANGSFGYWMRGAPSARPSIQFSGLYHSA